MSNITDSAEWKIHFQRRKELVETKVFPATCLTPQAKRRAYNSLKKLSNEGYDPRLLLTKATLMEYRSFHDWSDCKKSRPLIESTRIQDVVRSNPEEGAKVVSAIAQKHMQMLRDRPVAPVETIEKKEAPETVEMRGKLQQAFADGLQDRINRKTEEIMN